MIANQAVYSFPYLSPHPTSPHTQPLGHFTASSNKKEISETGTLILKF